MNDMKTKIKIARSEIKKAYNDCNIKIRMRRMDIMISIIDTPYKVTNTDGYFQFHDTYPKETFNYQELTKEGKVIIDGVCVAFNELGLDEYSVMIEYGSSKNLFSCN